MIDKEYIMARPGVSYQDVATAANQVKGQGKNPTIENVRAILGTGSISTINTHLRKWKEAQNTTHKVASKENIPEELVSLMKGLWERVVNQSAEQVAALEENYQNTMSECQLELDKYKSNNQRWQQLYNQWLQEKTKLANDHLTIEQALQESQQNYTTLSSKQDVLLQQLQEKQERIDELNRLHKQSQTNLEHYRESVREQRLIEQQQFEQQKQEMQTEMKSQQEQIILLREKLSSILLEHQSLQQSYTLLEKQHSQTTEQLDKQYIKLVAVEKANNENSQATQHWQKQCKELQKTLDAKTTQFIDIQTEVNTLTRQLDEAKASLTELNAQNKLLAHDKWTVAQEKAQLEGQLKQMQKMITA